MAETILMPGNEFSRKEVMKVFGRGWYGRGMGWGGGWGRGNPYPFCRNFPGLPRRWWAMPYAGQYGAPTPYMGSGYPYYGGMGAYHPATGAPYPPNYGAYPGW